MKAVTGYQADDGSFFDTKIDAELHEAEAALREAMLLSGVAADSFLELTQQHLNLVERYVHAYKATQFPHTEVTTTVISTDGSSFYLSKQYTGQENTTRILEQSLSSGEPVSNLGSGTQSANVRDDSKGDGT